MLQTTSNYTVFTSGEIATILGESFARVRWLIRVRDIQPIGRVGITWIYDHAAIEKVRAEMKSVQRRAAAVT